LRTLETANDKIAPEYRDKRGPGEIDSIDSRVGSSPMFKIDVDHVEAQSVYHRALFSHSTRLQGINRLWNPFSAASYLARN
jgi:hypothetical protein